MDLGVLVVMVVVMVVVFLGFLELGGRINNGGERERVSSFK